jgi:hypothetical protein
MLAEILCIFLFIFKWMYVMYFEVDNGYQTITHS